MQVEILKRSKLFVHRVLFLALVEYCAQNLEKLSSIIVSRIREGNRKTMLRQNS